MSDSYYGGIFGDGLYDPFAQMERMHKRMSEMFNGMRHDSFGAQWDKNLDDLKTEVTRTDKNVIMTITIPGMEKKSADIKINEADVRISYAVKNIRDEKTAGRTMHSESSQSYMKIVPVPADAVPASARTAVDKESLVITFDKKSEKKK